MVSHETDEDVAKRLSHELNVTGRARRAPAPSYVPAPIKQGLDPERLKLLRKRQRDKARVVKDAAKAKAKARRAAAEAKRKKRKDARRAARQNADGAPERPKKAKKARVDEEDVTLAELLCADPLLKAEPLEEEPDPSADDDVVDLCGGSDKDDDSVIDLTSEKDDGSRPPTPPPKCEHAVRVHFGMSGSLKVDAKTPGYGARALRCAFDGGRTLEVFNTGE